jgi:hypothetical protein
MPGPRSSYLCFSYSWDDRHVVITSSFLLVEKESCRLCHPGWPQNVSLLISTSPVTRITDLNHSAQPYLLMLPHWWLSFNTQAGHRWLTPIILDTQEAEIKRIKVQSQPRQIVCEILSRKKPITKKSWWSGSRCRLWVQTAVPQKKSFNPWINVSGS